MNQIKQILVLTCTKRQKSCSCCQIFRRNQTLVQNKNCPTRVIKTYFFVSALILVTKDKMSHLKHELMFNFIIFRHVSLVWKCV